MNTLYVRTLKKVDHTVFCVADGQKFYFDPMHGNRQPYSSGQQVKRSLIECFCEYLGTSPSPTTFLFDISKDKKIEEGEVYGTCDPSYPDQLIGGWMRADKEGKTGRSLKRRSPLSISAMRPLHPRLANINSEDITFDRSHMSNSKVIVRGENGKELSKNEVIALLDGKNRSLHRKWIPDNKRANGFFVVDFAIDLRRLFSVSINPFEPEMTPATIASLRKKGWKEANNIFGPCLVAPKALRKQWIQALAQAILDWRITSNQARTFSLMETLAVTMSTDAHQIAASIRAKISEDDRGRAEPVIEEDLAGVDTFITLNAGAYTLTKSEKANALELAEKKLVQLLSAYAYE
ncbi:MAG TPA: hypothetical protein VHC48_11645 [Puia sp.]|nr:hypothetical protein [Puia sp.]